MVARACLGVVLFSSLFLLACSGDSPSDDDTQTPAEEASLVTAEAIKSFGERFAQNVRVPEVVQIPSSTNIDIDEVASLMSPDFAVRGVVPTDVTSYWRVSSVREKPTHWEVVIESVAGANFFAGSQFFVRHQDGAFLPVEAKEIGETPTTVVS